MSTNFKFLYQCDYMRFELQAGFNYRYQRKRFYTILS